MVTHLITNTAERRVTLLMSQTTLPVRQIATNKSPEHVVTDQYLLDAETGSQMSWHTDQQQRNLEYQPRQYWRLDSELCRSLPRG